MKLNKLNHIAPVKGNRYLKLLNDEYDKRKVNNTHKKSIHLK